MKMQFKFIFLFVIGFITASVSFFFYGPINGAFFNSDQAIHVLMVLDFDWPADAYYWGQNRLGSFLPMVSLPFFYFTKAHPILVLGLVNFSFVLLGFFILQAEIKSPLGKTFFLLILFFPHPTYHYLLLIGHPYAGQFFCLAVSIWFFKRLKIQIEVGQSLFDIKSISYLVFFMIFSFFAIWINELSVLLFLGLVLAKYDLQNKRTNLFLFSFYRWSIMKWYWLLATLLSIAFVYFFLYLKSFATVDNSYHKLFITERQQIVTQLGYFLAQVNNILFLRKHHSIFECIFYFSLFLGLLFVLRQKRQLDTLLILIVISCVLLFFLNWNYRSHFDAKYYIPIYIAFSFWIAYALHLIEIKWRVFLFLILIIPILFFSLDNISISRSQTSPFDLMQMSEKIPNGVLYGEYWDVYKLSGATKGRLIGVSMHDWDFRNKHKLSQILKNEVWYVYAKNMNTLNDSINIQLTAINEVNLLYSKKMYFLGSDTLLAFRRINATNFEN